MRPLIVIDGADGLLADALAEVRAAGWHVVSGWDPPSGNAHVVCTGIVTSDVDAAGAVLAAVAGAGLVVAARADRDLLDRLCDDLRRVGPLDHRTDSSPGVPLLSVEERALVTLLADGLTLGEAARRLNLSRRTADRRLASARQKLGARTTEQALIAAQRQGVSAAPPR